jgi:hypothetical protein
MTEVDKVVGRLGSMNALRHGSAVLFLCAVMSFPRSFLVAKLVCLSVFMLIHLIDYRWIGDFRINFRIFIFYACVAIGGMLWSFVGLVNSGEPQGAMEALRLYVAWSMAYFLILTLLRNGDGLKCLHSAIVLAGLLIAAVNIVGILDVLTGSRLFSQSVQRDLSLNVGFHDGYVQITSHNIGSLLFITPYLIAIQFCGNTKELNGRLTKWSLAACLLIAVLSGRRALWLALVMTPLIIASVAVLSGSLRMIRPTAQKLIVFMGCGVAFALILLMTLNSQPADSGNATLEHLKSAFSATDQRTIQARYLISAFLDQPILGSGFGAYAGYVRSLDRPWLYEHTYAQLLFNVGLVGMVYWFVLSGVYFFLASRVIRENINHSGQPLCLIVGVVWIVIGAYSNPYLASFDFLIFIAMLPYVASLNEPRAIRPVALRNER